MGDNVDVTHQSGCSRLLNSVLCAACVAPVLLLGSVIMLGANERSAVCGSRAITQGEDAVVETGCTSATEGDGELVLFRCDLSPDGLDDLTTAPGTAFASVLGFAGTGLSVTSEMYQCVESSSSETSTDSVGGGTTTVTTYTYSKQWRSSRVDSNAFSKKDSQNYRDNCGSGVENPAWPSEVPKSGVEYAESVGVGPYTITGGYVREVPLPTPVLADATPSGWTLSGNEYSSQQWRVSGGGSGSPQIGDVRVSFKGTDWDSRRVTVLGENQGGIIGTWTASDSWLCSGFTLGALSSGTVDKEDFFDDLRGGLSVLTYFLRILGFLLVWLALSRVAAPLGVVADCIPCIGPFLGDAVEAVACCVTCPPACACALGVIGVVWVAMRPLVGIPLILVFLCTCGGFIAYEVYSKSKGKGGQDAGKGGEVVGAGEEA